MRNPFVYLILVFSLFQLSCSPTQVEQKETVFKVIDTVQAKLNQELKIINSEGLTIKTRFNVPNGFNRVKLAENSFAFYLRDLPLKPENSDVLYYDGSIKINNNVYAAVVDLPIGKRDLHQCADAVMRLRAEYLWEQKRYDKIHFNFTNGFNAEYERWRQGERISVKGNNVNWNKSGTPSNEYKAFWKYLEMVFSYAGTLSLEKELKQIPFSEMKIGDIFIQGGSPGHAIIVVDIAVNKETGKRLYLLAQSYMPAQEIQILINPNNSKNSPWYTLNEKVDVYTPEWSFYTTDLKRFEN